MARTPLETVKSRLGRLDIGRKTSFGFELAERPSPPYINKLRQLIMRQAKAAGIKVSIHQNRNKEKLEVTRVA